MLDRRQVFRHDYKSQRYLMVIHTLYQQQLEMYEGKKHSVAKRILVFINHMYGLLDLVH